MENNKKTFIIAEIGNNHEGNFEVAKNMLIAAAKSGVDAVKFQTFIAERFVGISNPDRYKQIKSYELSQIQFIELKNIANDNGVEFLSTPLDLESAEFLNSFVSKFKISSSDNTFFPLIDLICSFNKPIILSSGISDIELLRKTVSFIQDKNGEKFIENDLSILHCVSSYPTIFEEAQLNSIKCLKNEFTSSIGYSDHTLGIDACIFSAVLGASIIEKHFTLDHNFSNFRDHQISANPSEMKLLVDKIRLFEQMLGQEKKTIGISEQNNINAFRRSIVAKREIQKGEILTMNDLCWTRPSGGISPGDEGILIGKKAVKLISQGEMIFSNFVF